MTGAETDEALMAAYIKGDREAFVYLFDRYAPHLHRFFLQIFHDVSVADDMLQVTFLKLHKARATYNPSMPFKPWIFTIASRVRLDEFRRRGRLKEDSDEEKLMSVDAKAALKKFDEVGREKELVRVVREVIAKLPESYRAVLYLHRYEQMTFREIASSLGISENAAKVRAFRAYEQLRAELGPLLLSGLN
jgi:RNA polymerase sigma-70 factor, ECF subfamily